MIVFLVVVVPAIAISVAFHEYQTGDITEEYWSGELVEEYREQNQDGDPCSDPAAKELEMCN